MRAFGLSSLFVSVLCALLKHVSSDFAMVIEGCFDVAVNGVYVCETPATCHNVNEQYRLFKLYKMFYGMVRGKWYISSHNAIDADYLYSRLPLKEENEEEEDVSDSGVALYGWKYADRDKMQSVEQEEMSITRYPLQCAFEDNPLAVPIATFENVSLLDGSSNEDHLKLSYWTLVQSMAMRVDNKKEVSPESVAALRHCVVGLLTHVRLSFDTERADLFLDMPSQTNTSLISKTVDILDSIDHGRGKVSHLLPLCVWLGWEGAWMVAERCYNTILLHFDIEAYLKDHKGDERYGTEAISASQAQSTVHCFTYHPSSTVSTRKNSQLDLCILLHELVKYSTGLISKRMDVKKSLSVVRKMAQYDYDWWISEDDDDHKEGGMSRFMLQLVGLDSLCCFLLYGNARKGADRSAGAEKMDSQKDTLTSLQLQSAASDSIENVQKASLYGLSRTTTHADAVMETMEMVRNHLFSSSSSQSCFIGWNYCLSSDQARSLLLSLMLQGNIEVVASHVSSFTMAFVETSLYDQAGKAQSASPNENVFLEYQSILSSFGELYDNTNNGRNSLEELKEDMIVHNPRIKRLLSEILSTDATMLSSSALVRHTLALHQIFHSITDIEKQLSRLPIEVTVTRERGGEEQSKAFGIFLTTFMQLASPTVLAQPHIDGKQSMSSEPLVLRLLMVDMLESLTAHIRAGPEHALYSYTLSDPILQVGSKSLFLLAYQGIQSAVMSGNRVDVGKHTSLWGDAVVPGLYYTYIKRSHPFFPWSFSRSDGNDSNGSNDNDGNGSNDKSTKVAFVSSFFKEHSVGRLFSKIVAKLHSESNDLDVHVVSLASSSATSSGHDDVQTYLQENILPSHYHYYSGDVRSIVNALRALQLDIVVFTDNFMDSSTAHVMMFRVAPMSIACWGHPYTSGYAASIDYFISSVHYEPHLLDSDDSGSYRRRISNFAEQLIVFDTLNFQFFDTKPDSNGDRQELYSTVTAIGTDLYSMPAVLVKEEEREPRFYAILQSLMKMHPSFDNVIAQLLIRDPLAIILLSWNPYQLNWNHHWKQRMIETIKQHLAVYNDGSMKLGDMIQRVLFLPKMSHKEYASIVCSSSVSLDPFPFGGGVTMVDALSCSETVVPFVTTKSLHSVHALAHGMLSYMQNNTNSDNALCRQVCHGSKSGEREPECTCMEADGMLRGISVDTGVMGSYTDVAIRAAEQVEMQRSQSGGRRDGVVKRLYHDDAVVEEWRELLNRL